MSERSGSRVVNLVVLFVSNLKSQIFKSQMPRRAAPGPLMPRPKPVVSSLEFRLQAVFSEILLITTSARDSRSSLPAAHFVSNVKCQISNHRVRETIFEKNG